MCLRWLNTSTPDLALSRLDLLGVPILGARQNKTCTAEHGIAGAAIGKLARSRILNYGRDGAQTHRSAPARRGFICSSSERSR